MDRSLKELARLEGVQLSYRDGLHRRQNSAPAETLLAVLRALGAPVETLADVPAALREVREARLRRFVEPVQVAWEGRGELELRPRAGESGTLSCHLTLETGETRRWSCSLSRLPARGTTRAGGSRCAVQLLPLPEDLPRGYHQLAIELRGNSFQTLIISAPRRAYVPPADPSGRTWGVFLPLHALHSRRSWGSGSFSDLEGLMEWVGNLGGGVVATLPLLAAFLDEPCDPSPYAPVSRLFWNEFYLDVARIPELSHCREAQKIIQSPSFRRELASLRRSRLLDYRRGMAAKRKVLEVLSRWFHSRGGERQEAFRRFVSARPGLKDYARFRAACERFRQPWTSWPRGPRGGRIGSGDHDRIAYSYHLYVQWLAQGQLRDFAENARRKGRTLYLDYPLGVHGLGYDVWRYRDSFAGGVTSGAPPDAFFTGGQNWGFPPPHPENIRKDGYSYFRACLRHQLQHSGILRIDHVMGLHRLYWIPEGTGAASGVYVRYRPEELYAILALESQRHETLIVGEDLGTVPRSVRPAMARHGILRTYVGQFETDPGPRRSFRPVPANSLASLNTHDTPTFASFWKGLDLKDRRDLGLLTAAGERKERARRKRLRSRLIASLGREGRLSKKSPRISDVLAACLAYLAESPARVAIYNLEDFWGEELPQNVPGTGPERPNWRRRARLGLEDLKKNPRIRFLLNKIHKSLSDSPS